MNKRFQITAIAVVLAAASGSSFADEPGGFFINTNLGSTSYNSGDATNRSTPFSTAVRVGYSWYSEAWDFGVEAGYVNLGTVHGTIGADGISASTSAHAYGPLLGINLKYKFANQWFISGRVGYLDTTLEQAVSGLGSETNHGGGGYGGLGVGYDFTKHFSVALSYDNYRCKVKLDDRNYSGNEGMSSVFLEYRF